MKTAMRVKFNGYPQDSIARMPMVTAKFCIRVSRLIVAMIGRHTARLPLAVGVILFAFAGCSAPVGPLGGPHLAGCCIFTGCHYQSRTCDEDDPKIVPPHSNFHPLPTRPVFTPPEAIPGLYAPWPGENPIPPREAPVTPLEVQSTPPKTDELPTPQFASGGSAPTNARSTQAAGVTLRR